MPVDTKSGQLLAAKQKKQKKKKIQFHKGQVFKTITEIDAFLIKYNHARKVKISRARTKSRKGKEGDSHQELSVYEVDLQCYRSGKYVSRAKTNPPTRKNSCNTKKTNCQFKVTLRDVGKKGLSVRKMDLTHNHESPYNSEKSSHEDSSSDDDSSFDGHSSPGEVGDFGNPLEVSGNHPQEGIGETAFQDILHADFALDPTPAHTTAQSHRSPPLELESSQDRIENTVPPSTLFVLPEVQLSSKSVSFISKDGPVDLTSVYKKELSPLNLTISSVARITSVMESSVPSNESSRTTPVNDVTPYDEPFTAKPFMKTYSRPRVPLNQCQLTESDIESTSGMRKALSLQGSQPAVGISEPVPSTSSIHNHVGVEHAVKNVQSFDHSSKLSTVEGKALNTRLVSIPADSQGSSSTLKTPCEKLSQSDMKNLAEIKYVQRVEKPIGAPRGRRTNVIGMSLKDKKISLKGQGKSEDLAEMKNVQKVEKPMEAPEGQGKSKRGNHNYGLRSNKKK